MIALGCDPGKTGGIARIDTITGEIRAQLLDTSSAPEVADTLRSFMADTVAGARIICGVEKVHSMPKQGVSSSFAFGRSLGIVEGALSALGLPWVYVRPQEWRKLALADRPKPKGAKEGKKAVLEAARARWPDAPLKRVKDSGVADALFIALCVARREA